MVKYISNQDEYCCCCIAFGHLLFIFMQDVTNELNEIYCYDAWFDKEWIKCPVPI